MRILLIAWYFPPTSTIAAVRLGRIAQHLLGRGHDVRVLCPREIPAEESYGVLASYIPEERVVRTRWLDVNALPRAAARWLNRARSAEPSSAKTQAEVPSSDEASTDDAKPSMLRRLLAGVRELYTLVLNWPDSMIGWLPYGVASGRRLAKNWKPDLIFASAPPFTVLLVGYWLSRLIGVPWVVEFRDRWSDDPYYPPPRWVTRLNIWAEGHIVRRTAGLVTVSDPWAETYRRRYGKPTATICNGFDDPGTLEGEPGPSADGPLRIVYTGWIYPGRRDPSPLMEAIQLLGEGPDSVRLEFYGTAEAHVAPLIARYRLQNQVDLFPDVSHDEALRIQRGADVLLLMQWNDPKEQGNIPGKFFEYLGAKRPILVLGLEDGVPATLARERKAGVYGGSPGEIAEHLRTWIELKRQGGGIPAPPESARRGFSRSEQFDKLADFLEGLLKQQPELTGRPLDGPGERPALRG